MFDAIDLSTDIPRTITKMDNEEESNDVEQGVEPMAELTKIFSFCERMKRLSRHWLPLKERMKDQTIIYVILLCPNSFPARLEEDPIPRVSRRLALQNMKLEDQRAI